MAITTTITWGRTLTADEEALVQEQLTIMADAGKTDHTPDPGTDPEVRIWIDINSAMDWQAWTRSGVITPGPVSSQIALP